MKYRIDPLKEFSKQLERLARQDHLSLKHKMEYLEILIDQAREKGAFDIPKSYKKERTNAQKTD